MFDTLFVFIESAEDDDYDDDEPADTVAHEVVVSDIDMVMSEAQLAASGQWMEFAACRNLYTDIFFPKRNGIVGPDVKQLDRRRLDVAAGRRNASPADLCQACPVRGECLSEAIHGSCVGVWGGRTRLGRNLIKTTLLDQDPARVVPMCGTLDGWYAHLRHVEHGPPCNSCTAEAVAEDHYTSTIGVGPLRRALGESAWAAEDLPDASEEVPAPQPLLFI